MQQFIENQVQSFKKDLTSKSQIQSKKISLSDKLMKEIFNQQFVGKSLFNLQKKFYFYRLNNDMLQMDMLVGKNIYFSNKKKQTKDELMLFYRVKNQNQLNIQKNIFQNKFSKTSYFLPYFKNLQKELLINEEGEYSVTKPLYARAILNIVFSELQKKSIKMINATGNMGGDTINFALSDFVDSVKTFEINPENYKMLVNNLEAYNLHEKKVSPKLQNFIDYINEKENVTQMDFVLIDAPWGGKDYKEHSKMNLFLYSGKNFQQKININQIILQLFDKKVTKMVVLKVPNNYDMQSVFDLVSKKYSSVQVSFYDIHQKFYLGVFKLP